MCVCVHTHSHAQSGILTIGEIQNFSNCYHLNESSCVQMRSRGSFRECGAKYFPVRWKTIALFVFDGVQLKTKLGTRYRSWVNGVCILSLGKELPSPGIMLCTSELDVRTMSFWSVERLTLCKVCLALSPMMDRMIVRLVHWEWIGSPERHSMCSLCNFNYFGRSRSQLNLNDASYDNELAVSNHHVNVWSCHYLKYSLIVCRSCVKTNLS